MRKFVYVVTIIFLGLALFQKEMDVPSQNHRATTSEDYLDGDMSGYVLYSNMNDSTFEKYHQIFKEKLPKSSFDK